MRNRIHRCCFPRSRHGSPAASRTAAAKASASSTRARATTIEKRAAHDAARRVLGLRRRAIAGTVPHGIRSGDRTQLENPIRRVQTLIVQQQIHERAVLHHQHLHPHRRRVKKRSPNTVTVVVVVVA
jgi:hypothetical protein